MMGVFSVFAFSIFRLPLARGVGFCCILVANRLMKTNSLGQNRAYQILPNTAKRKTWAGLWEQL